MELPKTKTPIDKTWKNQKFLMLGAGKIGKSAFWAKGEKTLFLECEPGLNHLEVYKVPCRSWSDIRDTYAELYKAAQHPESFPYDTIVIDTIDRFVGMANEETIMRAKEKYKKEIADGINSLGDIPNGSGWYASTELIGNALKKFEALPCAVVLIGHVEKKTIKEPTREVTRDTISIGGQTGTNFLHWSDHTLMMRARLAGDNIERCFRTKPTDTMEAGSRGDIVPDGFIIAKDLAASYKEFRGLFT